MSIRLQQVKALLQGIRDDNKNYDGLRALLEQQRLCMIRRASDELLAVNETIMQHYERLNSTSLQRRSLFAAAWRQRKSRRSGAGFWLAARSAE